MTNKLAFLLTLMVGAAAAAQPSHLRIAGAQLRVTTDVAANVTAINRAIDFAQREKADVLVTREGWAVVVNAGDPVGCKGEPTDDGPRLLPAPSGVVDPNGSWKVLVPSAEEQFFVSTIEFEAS